MSEIQKAKTTRTKRNKRKGTTTYNHSKANAPEDAILGGLPILSKKEIETFRILCKREFSVTLTSAEAGEAATAILHLFCLTSHEIFSLRQKEQ